MKATAAEDLCYSVVVVVISTVDLCACKVHLILFIWKMHLYYKYYYYYTLLCTVTNGFKKKSLKSCQVC